MGFPSVSNSPASFAQDISSLSVSDAIQVVQQNRAIMLEGQLKTQIGAVQERNTKINDLNGALNSARSLVSMADSVKDKDIDIRTLDGYAEFEKFAKDNGIPYENIKTISQLNATVDNIKTSVDSLGGSQQIDLLRLQSLSNKLNESYELRTNSIKKDQDVKSGIIGNMRN